MADVVQKLNNSNLVRERSYIVRVTPTGVVYKVADPSTVDRVNLTAQDAKYTARWRFYTKYTA